MTALRQGLQEYLALRRSLGTKLYGCGNALHRFVDFLDQRGASHISRELAVAWAVSTGAQPATCAQRLCFVRGFAQWLAASDPRHEVPSARLLPYRYLRKTPYIYRDDEVEALIREATRLESRRGLRALSHATLFGLLAATGMRLCEALALDNGDVDLTRGILTIRRTKFGKSRFIPMHESTRLELTRYAERRDTLCLRRPRDAFFISDKGIRLGACGVRHNFVKVSRAIGLRADVSRKRHGWGPRLHDLRHRFAAKRMVAWYRAGVDVERELPKLATYLGHVHVNETYWYLQAVPELLQLATERLVRAREVLS